VACGSAKGSSTVPVVDWPFRTESGLIESAPMVPAAIAGAGSKASAASTSMLVRSPTTYAVRVRAVD
jgi:hypothetical protein